MKEKQQRKLIRDAAEEVCWSLSRALVDGLNDRELALFIKDDFTRWVALWDFDAADAD